MTVKKHTWVQAVNAGLPPEERSSERNRAITAMYARWYLEHPSIFKWAGMAAFASRQVGVAIAAAELLVAPERLGPMNPLVGMHRTVSGLFMRDDLEVIRSGNNGIFNDIAWAHEAYLRGGFREIEACAEGSDRDLLLEGFSLIDRGAHLAASGGDPVEAGDLIWQGNIVLLRHEQIVVLQPVFEQLSPGGRIIASFGSELDFSGIAPSDPQCIASFSGYSGFLETIMGTKSVTDAAHRWAWVESSVIPAWMEADRRIAEDPGWQRELLAMAAVQPGVLHLFTDITGRLLPRG